MVRIQLIRGDVPGVGWGTKVAAASECEMRARVCIANPPILFYGNRFNGCHKEDIKQPLCARKHWQYHTLFTGFYVVTSS